MTGVTEGIVAAFEGTIAAIDRIHEIVEQCAYPTMAIKYDTRSKILRST